MEPNVRKKLTVALVALAVPLTGGVAYALADSIDTRPDPEIIIPSGSRQPAGSTAATVGTTPVSAGATVPTTPGTTGEPVPTTPATVDDDVPVIVEQPPATVDDHGGRSGSSSGPG